MKNLFTLALLLVFASTVLCTDVLASVKGPSLPDIFRSALAEVKAKTRVPLLLPTELPRPFSDAKHVSVDVPTASEYGISLYYELDVGNAGFAASFAAANNPSYSPRELVNVREVKLAAGTTAFFRPVSCGGSCAPANLWWEQGSVLYQIQLKVPSTLPEKNQQEIITALANSAIQAGPR
jgi:hypothetical protein